jgi:CheY-like chemotaxis protein
MAMARVLVADNCPDTLHSWALLLRLWGHSVETAGDGPAALVAALTGRPDVVLMDVALRDLDGLAVARRLREKLGPHRPLLVAATGCEGDRYRRAAFAAGFDFFLLKPAEADQLRAILAAAPAEPLPGWDHGCPANLAPCLDWMR